MLIGEGIYTHCLFEKCVFLCTKSITVQPEKKPWLILHNGNKVQQDDQNNSKHAGLIKHQEEINQLLEGREWLNLWSTSESLYWAINSVSHN